MFPNTFARLVEPPLTLARIESQERDAYAVIFFSNETGTETHARARLAGSLRHAAFDVTDLPAVGDYVALDIARGASEGIVRALLPRRNLFTRRAPGGVSGLQPIAANLDTLFVAVACNRDFNLRRIERYLAGADACAVSAAVVLTKTDLATDVTEYVGAAHSVAAGRSVIPVAALERVGLDAFDGFRGPGSTLAFVGSSGAGKSTLLNALLGSNVLATGSARDEDDRGRHTTTRRQMLYLADGTAIVDTPGMREFGLTGDDESVAASFDDITALSTTCRFRDCRHESEPGCAVVAELDDERLSSYRKLTREALFEQGKTDRSVRDAEKRRLKSIAKSARSFNKRRS